MSVLDNTYVYWGLCGLLSAVVVLAALYLRWWSRTEQRRDEKRQEVMLWRRSVRLDAMFGPSPFEVAEKILNGPKIGNVVSFPRSR